YPAPMSTFDQFRLDGKAAIVTGASRGIGAAIAVALADAGAHVSIVARTAVHLEHVAADIGARDRRALVHAGDVTDATVLAALVDRTVAELGGVDIVVNNAGGSLSRPFLETKARHFEKAFAFNVVTAFELSRMAVL